MKLTPEIVASYIAEEFDYKLGEKTTVVLLKLTNGFEVIGKAGCIDPANYNHEIGKKLARERAVTKLWELLGFHFQEINK